MADLAIIVPTRERADRFRQMVDAVQLTATEPVEIIACVDDDDPQLDAYRPVARPAGRLLIMPRRPLSMETNIGAQYVLNPRNGPVPQYLASMGDDHLPRSRGWDVALKRACGQLGYAYGDDGLQGERLPTAWVQSAEIVRRLGWMMQPTLAHMYVDNAILALGRAAGCITYLPDVLIEHMHPIADKAPVDDSYRASNHPDRYRQDKAAFQRWVRDGLAADVEKLQGQGVPVG